MSKEIVISVSGEQSRIAIIENGELVELYVENPDNVRTIGDIYLAKVRRIHHNIKAAFVDIGQKQDAFLHFSDLSDNLPALIDLADGKVRERSDSRALATAPASDTVEAESAEEQVAARRSRDLRRTRRSAEPAREADADATESADTAAEAPSRRRSREKDAEPSRRSRSRRAKADAPDAEAPETDAPAVPEAAVPEAAPAPAILPPEAVEPLAEPETDSLADDAEDTESGARRRRRRRRGRGRNRGRGTTDADASQETDDDEPEASATEEAPATEKPPRRRSRRAKDAPSEAATESAPEAAAPDAPAAAADEPAQEPPARPKRRRGSKPVADTPADAPGETPASASEPGASETGASEPGASETGDAEPTPARPKRRRARSKAEPSDSAASEEAETKAGSSDTDASAPAEETPKRATRSRSRKTAPPDAAQSSSAEPEKESKQEPKAEAKTEPKPEPKAEPPARPSASRFVIDLTSKPQRPTPRREEEEEEEERGTSSRRRRGGGRSNGRSASGRSSQKRQADAEVKEALAEAPSDDSPSSRDDDEFERDAPKRPSGNQRLEQHLRQDQRVLVKITKEPISAKGSRVSTDISLAGRFLVLVPAADYVAVSKKIESAKERRRLRALARSLLPEGFGLIVRTVAEGRDAKVLDTDLRLLLEKWYKAEEILKKRPDPPQRLYEDVNMVSSIVRDLFSDDYDRILIDDPTVYKNVRSYVQAVAPHMAEAVKLHKAKEPVFRTAKIEREVRAAFETRVPLPGGGYLFIETTEAMHVVDVNSGRAGRGLSQEENAVKVNLEAAREIAKQLRLRDLGGIICVDFIDMRSESYRKKVYDELKREFRKDRAVTKLLPMSDFGVVEITRQRLRPSITTTVDVEDLGPLPETEPEALPAAEAVASAPTRTTEELIDHLDRWIRSYREQVQEQHRSRPILLRVHPLFAAYLTRGIPSQLTRWKFRSRLKLKLDVDETAHPLTFSVRDEKSGKNLTRKYDPDRAG